MNFKPNHIINHYFFYLIFGTWICGLPLYAQSLEERTDIAKGNQYYLTKNYENAVASYAKVLIKTPNSVKANYNSGNAYYELKKYDKAIPHYQTAAKEAESKADKAIAFHNLGNAYMQQKDFKNSIEAYKNSLRNNPKDNETRYNLALAKKLLTNQQNNQNNPPDLPKPSEFALAEKRKADAIANQGNFGEALKVMQSALGKDSTVMHFKQYMDKLLEINILDTIQNK